MHGILVKYLFNIYKQVYKPKNREFFTKLIIIHYQLHYQKNMLAFLFKATGEISPIRISTKNVNDITCKDIDLDFDCHVHMENLMDDYFILCHVENDVIWENGVEFWENGVPMPRSQPENLAWNKFKALCKYPDSIPQKITGTCMLVLVDEESDDDLVDYDWNWTECASCINEAYEFM